jgi:hypothetical protein
MQFLFSFFRGRAGMVVCLALLPGFAFAAPSVSGVAGADTFAPSLSAVPGETTAAAMGARDSITIQVDSASFTACYLEPLACRTLGDLLAWTPGIRTIKLGDFGTGEWLVYDGDLVRPEQVLCDGNALLFADRVAADVTLTPLEGATAVGMRPIPETPDIQTGIAPSAFPASRAAFHLNNLLPFLSVDNTWLLGGFQLARRLGPVNFFAGYQMTKNRLFEPAYADFNSGQSALGAQWSVKQRWRLTAWARHAAGHTYAAGRLLPFTVRNDHRRSSACTWEAADDSLQVRLYGSVAAQSWPHPAAGAYTFLGKDYTLYRYQIGLEKDVRWASRAQQSQLKCVYHDGAGYFTSAAEQRDQRLAFSVEHSGDLAPALRGTGWTQVTVGPAFRPQIDPGLKFAYTAAPRIQPFGAVWQESFVPSLTERFLADTSIQPCLRGNPALVPEHRTSIKTGAALRPSQKLRGELSLFYRRYDAMLAEEPRPDTVRMVNSGRAAAGGANVMLSCTLATGWEAAGNYSYVWSRTAATGFAFAHRPEHAGRARIGYHTSFYRGMLRPAATLEAQYQSTAWSYNYSRGAEVSLPAFWVCHMLVSVQILDLRMFFYVENLCDRRYAYQAGWPMPRRYQRMGLEWNFWN